MSSGGDGMTVALNDLALEDLLVPFGFDSHPPNRTVKLVRHIDARLDINALHRDGLLELYQSYQSAPVFSNAKTLVSFIGRGQRQAVFFGVFDVGKASPPGVVSLPADSALPVDVSGHHHYKLFRKDGYEALVYRLVIDWGAGARS